MLTIGLCGGTGTGKTTAQSIFSACGIPGIDTDAVYHSLTDAPSPLTQALADRFGQEILTNQGALDRARLGRIVFSEGGEAARADLNRLTHGAVLDVCRAWLAERKREGCFAAIVNAPLLFESGFDRECDLTVAVLASRECRCSRLMARDGMGAEEASRRIDAQLDDSFLIAHTDFQIVNDGSREQLYRKVYDIVEHIKQNTEECTYGKRKSL